MGLFPDSAVELPVWAWAALAVLVVCTAGYRWFSPSVNIRSDQETSIRTNQQPAITLTATANLGLSEAAVEAAFQELQAKHLADKWFTPEWARCEIQLWLDRERPNPFTLSASTCTLVLAYRDALKPNHASER